MLSVKALALSPAPMRTPLAPHDYPSCPNGHEMTRSPKAFRFVFGEHRDVADLPPGIQRRCARPVFLLIKSSELFASLKGTPR